jgi:predicted nucleic acid-binding protein
VTLYWLDANVVLRFLTGDPEEMAREARGLFERAEQGEVALFLPVLVVAEIVWVLHSFYDHDLPAIDETLSGFLTAPGIEAEDLDVVLESLHLAATRNVDFVDAYLAARATREGAPVCTFDASDFERLPATWRRPGAIGAETSEP